MNIHTVIDDQLFSQAVNATGMSDKRMLLEYALRTLLQAQQAKASVETSNIGFWAQLQDFRAEADLSELKGIDEIFADVRDKTTGRVVEL